jgi:hypothetical protein
VPTAKARAVGKGYLCRLSSYGSGKDWQSAKIVFADCQPVSDSWRSWVVGKDYLGRLSTVGELQQSANFAEAETAPVAVFFADCLAV